VSSRTLRASSLTYAAQQNIQRPHVLGIEANPGLNSAKPKSLSNGLALPRAAAVAEVGVLGAANAAAWRISCDGFAPMFARYLSWV